MEANAETNMDTNVKPNAETNTEMDMETTVGEPRKGRKKPQHRIMKYDPEMDKPKLLEARHVTGIARDEWGADPPFGFIKPMLLPLSGVIMSYTGSRPCTTREECMQQVRKLQRKHVMKGYPDIKYSFLVGGDGCVYEGRGWDLHPQKNKMYPKLFGSSIEIGLISRRGNYVSKKAAEKEAKMHVMERKYVSDERRRNNKPTPDMFHTAFDLIEFGNKNRYIEDDHIIVNSQ